ncbi:MAG: prephenate/arogenate dehydrogenase family protein [Hyphomicrobiales bacterium]|nr:prephenate/arogenate dehydrogenase family protein [Hyphomicrobiales bacterium]
MTTPPRPDDAQQDRRGASQHGAAAGPAARGTAGALRDRAPSKDPTFNHLALIGVGLIGSSIARAARSQNAVRTITATARSPATRRRVAELGLADHVVETNIEAVEGADLVIVCIPVGACGPVAAEIAPHLAAGATVSDVGSVKGAVVRDMGPHIPAGVHFVPAHPVAGTENSGPDAGFAELFVNRWCILTPPPGVEPTAVERLCSFWRLLGANVETMSPEHHDLVLGITSHLPHLIAYTIVGTAEELSQVTRSEVLQFSAGGFRDFTRIAASDPTMWRDVFLANKDAVLEMLGRFNEDLATLTRAIRRGDGDTLHQQFTRTRAIRRGIVEMGQDSPAPDFGRAHPDLPSTPLPRPYAVDD